MPIAYSYYGSADNANVLTGSDLQSAPGPGVLLVYSACTGTDTKISVSAPPEVPMRSANMIVRPNAEVKLSDDIPVVVPLAGGEQITIAVDITAASNYQVIAIFIED